MAATVKANTLLAEALRAMREPEEAVPKGWLTSKQWAAEERRAESTIRKQLRVLTDAGKIELKFFKVRTGQLIRPVPHYRLK